MRPHQQRSRGIHRIEIQPGIPALPRKRLHERIFGAVKEIGIFPPPRIETRMEIRSCGCHRKNHHRTGQDGIQFVAEIICRKALGAIETRNVTNSVHAGVRTPRSDHWNIASKKLPKSIFEALLHAWIGRLALPAAEAGAGI